MFVDRRRQVIRFNTPVARECAFVDAASAAVWLVVRNKRVGNFKDLDSAEDVATEAGWQTVRKVTVMCDTVLQPNKVFDLFKFLVVVHIWLEDDWWGIPLRVPTTERMSARTITAWGEGQV